MKNKSLLDSFNTAMQGVIHTLIHERNFRIHFVSATMVLVLSLLIPLNVTEFLLIVVAIAFVIITELLNTAIEAIVDLICQNHFNPYAKIAKDTAAGAVFISSMIALIIGYFLLYKKLMDIGFSTANINKIRHMPVYITFVCMILTVMFTIIIKAITKAENLIRGGMPSAHAALAFCAATSVMFLSDHMIVIFLSFFLAALVAQSRVDAKIHSIIQVLLGSAFGFFVTTLIFQLFDL